MTRGRRESGAVSVEFALVVPIFLVIVGMGAFFAWRLFTESQLERAAQRAARHAAVPTSEGAYAYQHCALVDVVNAHLSAFTVAPDSVTVSDDSEDLPATPCPDSAPGGRPHGVVRVRVTHEVGNPFSWLVGMLTDRPGTMHLSGSGEARVEDTT